MYALNQYIHAIDPVFRIFAKYTDSLFNYIYKIKTI